MSIKKGITGVLVLFLILFISFFLFKKKEGKYISPPKLIVCFGDSLTSGEGAGIGEDYPSQLGKILGIKTVNAGVPGDTTSSALRRLEKDVLVWEPDLVIILLGGNDFLQRKSMEETVRNIKTIIRILKERGIEVLLISPVAYYDQEFKKVSKRYNTLFLPHIMRKILLNPELKSDEVHPNSRGYQVMAEIIAKKLKKHIHSPR